MKILGIGMIGFAVAIMLWILTSKKIMKDIENDYVENLLDKENKIKNYKKLVNDLKIELSNCQGTQFYNNTNLALRRVSKVITDFENTNY